MTLDDYLNAARSAPGMNSDRKLSLAIGHSGQTVCRYRNGRDLPDDGTMLRLATLAGVSSDRALLDLNTWRAKSPDAQAVYRKLAATISAAAITVVLLGVPAGNGAATARVESAAFMHYATFLYRLIYRLLGRIAFRLPRAQMAA